MVVLVLALALVFFLASADGAVFVARIGALAVVAVVVKELVGAFASTCFALAFRLTHLFFAGLALTMVMVMAALAFSFADGTVFVLIAVLALLVLANFAFVVMLAVLALTLGIGFANGAVLVAFGAVDALRCVLFDTRANLAAGVFLEVLRHIAAGRIIAFHIAAVNFTVLVIVIVIVLVRVRARRGDQCANK